VKRTEGDTASRPLGTPEQVSNYLSVPIRTLYAWKYEGRGPRALKVGKHLRYRWSDVESWLENEMAGGRS
jgi:excisionase family DNA binding protein